MIDRDTIKAKFIEMYLGEEELPDIIEVIHELLEEHIEELAEEIADEWEAEREEYLRFCKEEDEHHRHHAVGVI